MNQTELENLNIPVVEGEIEEVYDFKLKPVWQFQSVEVVVSGTKKDISKIMDLYSEILAKLMLIAPEQNKVVSQPAIKLATDKQKEIMLKHGIEFTPQTTSAEAQALIQQNMEKSVK